MQVCLFMHARVRSHYFMHVFMQMRQNTSKERISCQKAHKTEVYFSTWVWALIYDFSFIYYYVQPPISASKKEKKGKKKAEKWACALLYICACTFESLDNNKKQF